MESKLVLNMSDLGHSCCLFLYLNCRELKCL